VFGSRPYPIPPQNQARLCTRTNYDNWIRELKEKENSGQQMCTEFDNNIRKATSEGEPCKNHLEQEDAATVLQRMVRTRNNIRSGGRRSRKHKRKSRK